MESYETMSKKKPDDAKKVIVVKRRRSPQPFNDEVANSTGVSRRLGGMYVIVPARVLDPPEPIKHPPRPKKP